jgi:hypothetical protein
MAKGEYQYQIAFYWFLRVLLTKNPSFSELQPLLVELTGHDIIDGIHRTQRPATSLLLQQHHKEHSCFYISFT